MSYSAPPEEKLLGAFTAITAAGILKTRRPTSPPQCSREESEQDEEGEEEVAELEEEVQEENPALIRFRKAANRVITVYRC